MLIHIERRPDQQPLYGSSVARRFRRQTCVEPCSRFPLRCAPPKNRNVQRRRHVRAHVEDDAGRARSDDQKVPRNARAERQRHAEQTVMTWHRALGRTAAPCTKGRIAPIAPLSAQFEARSWSARDDFAAGLSRSSHRTDPGWYPNTQGTVARRVSSDADFGTPSRQGPAPVPHSSRTRCRWIIRR